MKKLTPKLRLFVHEYLIDLNATQAAIRAGYSKRTAKVHASRSMKLPHVKKAVEAALARKTNKLVMTREEILQELSIVGRFNLKHYQEIDEGGAMRIKQFENMPPNTSGALESIEETRTIAESKDGKETTLVCDKIKIKGFDKVRALELLGKHEGLFPTKVEANLNITGKLSINAMKKSLKDVEDGSGD